MRYLVTKQIRVPTEEDSFICTTPEKLIEYFEDRSIIGLDTETQGFDPYTKDVLLCQLGDTQNQFAIDNTIDLRIFKSLFEDKRKLFILHNAKFDLRFFYHRGIFIENVYDTFLGEKLLHLGYPGGMISLSLAACCKRYLDVDLDKSIRGSIHREGTSDRVIKYGCDDVKYLLPLMEAQLKRLEEEELLKAISFENEFTKWLAWIEYTGVKLDISAWQTKMAIDRNTFIQAEEDLNKWVIENAPEKYIIRDIQGDLFNPNSITAQCNITWSSPKQVIPLFEDLGFDLRVKDKATGAIKKSVDAKVIKGQADKSSISSIYLKYKAAEKVVSTYGQNFIDAINPVSHRIHTTFNQMMDTGRLSCGGGKDKDTNKPLVNLQNIPRDAATRACFIPEEGNVWISADYDGQESVLIANIAEDQAMIDFFNAGKGDIHSLVAKMVFPDILNDVPIEDVKALFGELRQEAKGYEFLINYGGDFNTMMSTYGLSRDRAQEIYNNYMAGFAGVATYQDFCRKDVMTNGFIPLNKVYGHKAYIYDYDQLKESQETIYNTPNFWDEYRFEKAQGLPTEKTEMVRKFFKRKSASEKQSINYRIQGAGAATFKLATIYFCRWLKENNLLDKVKYVIPVHDEINVECPKELAPRVEKALVEAMKAGGDPFCPHVKLTASASIGDHWIH